MSEIVERAERLSEQGYVVIPVHPVGPDGTCHCPRGKHCGRNAGKHPIGDGWNETTDGLEAVRQMVAKGRKPNLGVLVGPSGKVVVDIDPRNGGKETMKALIAKYGAMPRTKVNGTGSDGWHYYFQAPEGVSLKGTLGPGVDLKSSGMVVAEGSRSGTGEYATMVDAPVAELPAWIIEEAGREPAQRSVPVEAPRAPVDPDDPDLPRRQAYCNSAVSSEVATLDAMEAAKTSDGTGYVGDPWNNTVFRVACNILELANTPEAGLSTKEAIDLLIDHAPRDAGFGDVEILKIIESARERVGSSARSIPTPPFQSAPVAVATGGDDEDDDHGGGGPDDQHSGQVRMAYRLQDEFASSLMHVYGLGWHYWTGTHWEVDKEGHAMRAAVETIRKALAESAFASNGSKLRRDAEKCESAAGLNGLLSIAAALPEFSVTVEQLDANPYYLNVTNGTFDLFSQELRRHDPRDRITSVTRGAHRPDERGSGEWERFLESIMPDPDERAFLQRVVGQGLVGAVGEHIFPVLTGTGSNGKSTFYEALVAALGSYAIVIDPSLLMAQDGRRGGGPEMLRLMGTRIAIGSETNEGQKLDESVMKRLTGGDSLEARNLYKPPVQWTPSHQILYVTNHLPKVRGDDPAVWRRIRVIPFDVVIPDDQKDVGLKDRLILDADSILSWAIAGYYDYRDGGMRPPASVLNATAEYQQSSDVIRRFVGDECLTSPAATATTRELYSAWERWARTDPEARLLSEKAFSSELSRLGYEAKRTSRGKLWVGIAPLVTTGEGL